MLEEEWYQKLRRQWKPEHVRLLLIGESAPDDGGNPDNRRFFYKDQLAQADNLFRSVVAALYDGGKLVKGESKIPWLERLRNDGVYLIDLSPAPVNSLSPAERRIALKGSVEDCVRMAGELAPDGILICHAPSFALLAQPIRDAALPLLHDAAIPFPLGNKRAEFVSKIRVAVAKLPSTGSRFTPPDSTTPDPGESSGLAVT